MSEAKICFVGAKDYDDLYQIHQELEKDDRMSKISFFDEFKANFRTYFVAKINKKAVGYIGLFECDDDLNIIGIAVKKEYQHRGIGSLLIEFSKTYARNQNKKSLSLEVNEKNLVAINFYKKEGFSVTNIRKKYYKDNDALVMFCYL